MIEIKITVDTVAELHAQLQALLSGTAQVDRRVAAESLAKVTTIDAAVAEHTAAGTGQTATAASATTTEQAAPATRRSRGKANGATAPVMDAATMAAAEAAEAALEDTKDETKALKYEVDISPLVLDVVRLRGKAATVTLLQKFDAANAREIPETKWPAFITALNEELAKAA